MKRKGGAALLLGALLLLGACGGDSLETAAPETEAAARASTHSCRTGSPAAKERSTQPGAGRGRGIRRCIRTPAPADRRHMAQL